MIRCVSLTLRFPKITLSIALLLTIASVYFSQKLSIRSNFSDLLPDNTPSVIQARKLEKIVGGASFIVVAVENKNPAAAGRFINDLGNKIRSLSPEGILFVDDHPPYEFLKKEALMYLSKEDLETLSDKIKHRLDQGRLKKTHLYVDFEEKDDSFFSRDFNELKKKYPIISQTEPFYQNKEGTLFVSLIKPDWRTTEVKKTERFLTTLTQTVQDLNPQSYDPSLNIRTTGPYVKTLKQKTLLLHDATLISLVSFIGALAYLIFHFRKKRAVFLISIPLTLSVTWSLSLAYFYYGSLNLFSSAACAILLGIGADYGIHIYSEYIRFRKEGHDPESALTQSATHLAKAFLAASSTTAGAFFALALSHFKAFYELGMIAGSGILLCGISFFILFPPLTLLIERWKPEKIHGKQWTERRIRLSRTGLKWIFSKKNLVVSTFVLLLPLPITTLLWGKPHFDYNLTHIMGRQETQALDQKVDGIFTHTVNPEVILAEKPEDAGKIANLLRQIKNKKDSPSEGTTIQSVLSLQDFIPENQEMKIQKIHKIRSLFTDLILRGFSKEEKEAYEKFKGALSPDTISLQTLPDQITNKFRDRENGLGRTIFVFPNFDPSHADLFMLFVEELREIQCPDCKGPFYASGETSVFYDIVKMIFREGRWVVACSIVIIFIALFLNFRSLSSTFLVFSPLIIGLLGLLGWMNLLGIPFNIINLAAIPIILGTADDYAIHLYQRFKDHPSESHTKAYEITFRPIVGSFLTTIIGFGSLLLADMGGIRSFGLLSTLGISISAFTTLVWFPAFLALQKQFGRGRV